MLRSVEGLESATAKVLWRGMKQSCAITLMCWNLEVSSLIEQRVHGKKMELKLAELKKKAGIWMDEQYFGTAVATVPREQRPVSNPPSKASKLAEKRGEKQ